MHYNDKCLTKGVYIHTYIYIYIYSIRQYNVIVPYLQNETKQPFPLYKTPHPFRRNGRTVLKRSQNNSSLNKTMKNDSLPVAAPLRPLRVRPYHVIEAIAEMFLCPLETLHFILMANQLAIGTASEHPAQSSATPEDCYGVAMA